MPPQRPAARERESGGFHVPVYSDPNPLRKASRKRYKAALLMCTQVAFPPIILGNIPHSQRASGLLGVLLRRSSGPFYRDKPGGLADC